MSDLYFAADEPTRKVQYLIEKGESWFNGLTNTNYFDKIKRSWQFYHGQYYDSSHKVSYSGEVGEYVMLALNHYRNISEHIIKMITTNRPSFQARATNTDVKSQQQVNLANGLLDYYMREKKLERVLRTAVEYAVVMSRGYVKMEWNPMAGDVFDYVSKSAGPNQFTEGMEQNPQESLFNEIEEEQEQIPIFEGDVNFENLTPFDVVYDVNRNSLENQDWVMCRVSRNKYDLAAQYPELRDKILSATPKNIVDGQRVSLLFRDDTSDIYVYEFFHKKTPSMPKGNYCLFIDSDTIMIDTALPYRTLPIFAISFANILGTSFSYSTMFDLMPVQQCINSVASTIMTNINAHGVPNIISPRESGVKLAHIEGGMNFIEYDAAIVGNHKPEVLNLLNTSPEVYNYLNKLESEMEVLSAVNSVVRGDPQASLKSGSALALVQSQSLQFISGLQQSYVQLIEDTGTNLINLLRDFAHSPRIAAISGISNKSKLRNFTGEDIALVNRVIVDAGNALAQTPAGRLQIATDLIQMGLIKSPEQYLSVLTSGKLESMTEGQTNELELIREENERIINGDFPIMAIAYDLHSLHIKEHRAVAADSNLRADPELMQRLMTHINEHLELAATTRQDLLQYIGEPIMGIPPGQPGAAPGAMPNPAQQQMNPEMQEAQPPQMPMPAGSPDGGPVEAGNIPLA